MTNPKTKQLKINRLFKRTATAADNDDCSDLDAEIQQLEQQLKQKEHHLFQIRRHCLKRKHVPHTKTNSNFMRPGKIIMKNGIESVKQKIELYSMLSGMEVRSYVQGDHCCIIYHMQHKSKHAVQHGLKISLASAEQELTNFSLPMGFNYNVVMEDYDKMMTPECLSAVRKALVAYYDRLEQFDNLKTLINLQAQLFKLMDGSHMEISFQVQHTSDSDDDILEVVLKLDYRVYDIRPKQYSFKEIDLSEEALSSLREQCAVFKRKPLDVAFREAFVQGSGPYKLLDYVHTEKEQAKEQREQEEQRGRHRSKKRRTYEQNRDVTYNPYEEADSD